MAKTRLSTKELSMPAKGAHGASLPTYFAGGGELTRDGQKAFSFSNPSAALPGSA